MGFGLLFLLFAFNNKSLAQKRQNWRWQNPLPQGNTLRGSTSPDSNTLVFVGDAGMILKSTDGGGTFRRLRTGLRKDLYAVSFINPTLGMAVGEDGTIIKTTDCGKTWNKLLSGRNDTLRGISMLSETMIIAVGDTGTIIRSEDGGETWAYSPFPGLKSNLNDVFFPTGGGGFGAILGDSFPGFGGPPIIFSGDSGASYTPLANGGSFAHLANTSFNASWIDKSDPDKAVFVGEEGTIIATTDRGSTFEIPITPVTVPIKDVWFFDRNNGFACGPEGKILRTKDCGKSWTLINQPSQRDWLTMTFPRDSTGFYGGGVGGIITSPDGGVNFFSRQTGFFPNLSDVTFLDDSFGIAGRSQYGVAVGEFGSVLRTEDFGQNWQQSLLNTFDPIEAVSSYGDSTGSRIWIAGGQFGGFGKIWQSRDTAKTWQPQVIFSQFKFFDITFIDSLRGYVVGLGGVIFCTTDGGMSWNQKSSGSNKWLLDVEMTNDSSAYVVGGEGTILRTTNVGNSWTPQNSGTQEWLTSVSFLDDSFGIATGNHGVVLRTKDAGQNWEDIGPPGFPFDFTHLSLYRGSTTSNRLTVSSIGVTLVGQYGEIFSSLDGGDTWIEQNSTTNHHLQACYFSDSVTGTAVGGFGTILRTDSLISALGLEESPWEEGETDSPLGLNYPNPFSESTRIPFSIVHKAPVDLRIFDLQGRMVARLLHEDLTPGTYEYDWTPQHLPNGAYLYRLQIGHRSWSRKMLLRR